MNPDELFARIRRERIRKLRPRSTRLEPAVAERLARVALATGTSASGLVRVAIERLLDELETNGRASAPSEAPARHGGAR